MSQTPPHVLERIRRAKQENATSLKLPYAGLQRVPEEIAELHELVVLDLDHNQLQTLPAWLMQLPKLEKLDLRDNRFETIPEILFEWQGLERVWLTLHEKDLNLLVQLEHVCRLGLELNGDNDSIERQIQALVHLPNISGLDLSSNQLSYVSPEIGQLVNLTGLDLGSNQLSVVPSEIGQLVNLSWLYLSRNQLHDLPPEIGQLGNLTGLDISHNLLSHMPMEIGRLVNLLVLYLSSNLLSSVPNEIRQLVNLTMLDLRRNQLTRVPVEIFQLMNLTVLDLSLNQLSSVPLEVKQLVNLRALDLSGNQLSYVPSEIGKLANLTRVDLSSNQLSSVPAEIVQLMNLEHLDLGDNQIHEAPESIFDIKNLRDPYTGAFMRNNPLDDYPPEVVNKGLEAMREHHTRLKREGIAMSYEAKLLILGEGGAGKTTLRKRLMQPDYVADPAEISTHGIEVTRWKFPMPAQDGTDTGAEFRLNIWDFGGQEIYHATHQFFLSTRSLYVLVADQRKEDTDYYYWLSVAHTLGGGSPVLIVNNERGGRKAQLNVNAFRAEFKLLGPLELDLATPDQRHLLALARQIQQHVCGLPHVGQPISRKWKPVRDAIEQLQSQRASLTYHEFKDLCKQHGIERKQDRDDLSDYLHDLGICLHFRADEVLNHTVILQPEWATQAVYRVLDDATVQRNLGRFGLSDVARVLTEVRYEEHHDTVLRLMTRFKLCYPIPVAAQAGTPQRYIAPQLLPASSPAYPWGNDDNLWVEYRYENFMPKGIITRFIVDLHERIVKHGEQWLVWKSGVVVQDRGAGAKEATQAQVIEHYGQRKITVRVRGPNRRALWEVVRDRLDDINAGYSKPHAPLKVDLFTPCSCRECASNPDEQKHLWKYSELQNHHKRGRRSIPCPIGSDADVRKLIDDVFASPDLSSWDDLHKVLNDKFSLDELSDLCFELGIERENVVGNAATRPELVRKLIEYCARRDKLDRLRAVVLRMRPSWRDGVRG